MRPESFEIFIFLFIEYKFCAALKVCTVKFLTRNLNLFSNSMRGHLIGVAKRSQRMGGTVTAVLHKSEWLYQPPEPLRETALRSEEGWEIATTVSSFSCYFFKYCI